MKNKKPDRIILLIVLALLISGFFIFSSATLGEVSRGNLSFASLTLKQFSALIIGLIAMVIFSNVPYKNLKKPSLWIFIFSLFLTALVFVPNLGLTFGGAKSWLDLRFITFQPAEFLKLAFIIYLAAWTATKKDKIKNAKEGLIPFLAFLGIVGALLIKQPDTGTFLVIASGAMAIFIVAGAKWQHILIVFLLGLISLGTIAYVKPHVRDRILTFINPESDKLGSSYQINQSLIAIGSGGLTGRGYGQSIQKFNFLPQPIGDSIFAVASEEFGLMGSSFIIFLFLAFALWGLKIVSQISDPFGRNLGCGLIILITAQSFINIGAMLGVMPLTGIPLVFISHGGTAIVFALIEVGILLNISKNRSMTK